MSAAELSAIAPLLLLAAAPIALMLLIAFHRDHFLAAALTSATLAAVPVLLLFGALPEPGQVTPLIVIDGYARFFIGLIAAGALAVALLSYGFMRTVDDRPEEYYLLLLLATLGSAVLAASRHFASFFLGLELLSVSLYGLIAYPHRLPNHTEASVKYLILAGASAAFMLFGLALVYAATGHMTFEAAVAPPEQTWLSSRLWFAGWGLVMVGIGFKLALVPFHLWTPDIYQGAPAPVTAFVATVSKGAMFALLVRLFAPSGVHREMPLLLVFALIAVASMVFGNVAALLQNNLKRILAYSSIAHLGYLMVAFLATEERGVPVIAFYLVAYFVTMLGAFGVVTVLSRAEREAAEIADFEGLFWRRPWLGGILTAALLSLAGIPLTAGFIGKFYLVLAGVSATLWTLVLLLVVTSSVGLFYYLRVVVALYAPARDTEALAPVPYGGGAVLAVLAVALIGLGVYPGPFFTMLEALLGDAVALTGAEFFTP